MAERIFSENKNSYLNPEKLSMLIDYNILIAYGGVAKKIPKGEYIFQEGGMPLYYYQVLEGSVKVYTANDAGKELIQGVYLEGQSFGEPPLLLDKPYPSTAEAAFDSIIIRLPKEGFLNILNDFPEMNIRFLYAFADRIYKKSSAVQIWIRNTPEEKILQFFQTLKHDKKDTHIPYTRHQIACHTNLRTETVIRTLKRMEREGKIIIRNHKLFLK